MLNTDLRARSEILGKGIGGLLVRKIKHYQRRLGWRDEVMVEG